MWHCLHFKIETHPDAIRQRDFLFSLIDNFDPSLHFPNIEKCYNIQFELFGPHIFQNLLCFINFCVVESRPVCLALFMSENSLRNHLRKANYLIK